MHKDKGRPLLERENRSSSITGRGGGPQGDLGSARADTRALLSLSLSLSLFVVSV